MSQSCRNEVNDCLPCNDSPVENLSAEQPDLPTYLGIIHIPIDPPLPGRFSKLGCFAWAFSNISQEDAEALAALQDPECIPDDDDDDDGGGGEPEPDLYFPCDINYEDDCSSFDCCEGATAAYTYNYATRPRVEFFETLPDQALTPVGPTAYYLTLGGANSALIDPWVREESVDQYNGYAVENSTKFHCYWKNNYIADGVAVSLQRIGSRWELFYGWWQTTPACPVVSLCSADTGPPSFTCTAIGCNAQNVFQYSDSITVYTRNPGLMASVNPEQVLANYFYTSCPVGGLQTAIIGAGYPPATGRCWYLVVEGVDLWFCDGYYLSQQPGFLIPCQMQVDHYQAGAGTITHRSWYHAVRNSCLDGSSPRGTYEGSAGYIYEHCGYEKGSMQALTQDAIVTIEVPPP